MSEEFIPNSEIYSAPPGSSTPTQRTHDRIVNDSGFWLVGKFLGMTEKQTLQSWTVMETIIGGVGLVVMLIVGFFL